MKEKTNHPKSYWQMMWQRFYGHTLGRWALYVVILFCLVGIYAPFLASSKPFVVSYLGEWYFPLFRYLFFSGFFTKRLDIFFNLLIFTVPLLVLALWVLRGAWREWIALIVAILHCVLFMMIIYFPQKDPASDPELTKQRRATMAQMGPDATISWDFDLKYMNAYARLNLIIREKLRLQQHENLLQYTLNYPGPIPTLWGVAQEHEQNEMNQLQSKITRFEVEGKSDTQEAQRTKAMLAYVKDRRAWINENMAKLKFMVMPPLSHFHWEDDAGGQQSLNSYVPWWDLTRINRKDLLSALIFGVRISLTVGITAVVIALLIGIPIGAFAGYYGGKFDIVVSRLLEVWEAMPVFFMLLMVVALLQSKSIFLVTAVIGFFSWTQFSRYIRGEFFKQRNLPYVEACHALGFQDGYIIFKHILPNAIQPVLTLLPFAIMGAITSEAGLSFLGLGEEGSCSWGVLMDEGRTAFPAESYLLWPPAILLTILLVAIALVGDSLRDTLDPKR